MIAESMLITQMLRNIYISYITTIVYVQMLRRQINVKKVNKMVSKSFTLLSFSMPIAMSIGTSIAIEFYKNSSLILLTLSALVGLLGCFYLIVQHCDQQKTASIEI